MAIDWNNTEISDVGFVSTDWLYGAGGEARNLNTFGVNYSAMSLMARNRFKWKSDIIKPNFRLSDYIEMLLFYYGQCCIVNENGGWKIKKCLPVGTFNEFALPDSFNTSNYNGTGQKIYKYDDVIWIRNNSQCIPTYVWLRKYCDRISHLERVMDLNIDAQKTPYIIETTPEIQLSVKNVFKQIREMAQAVFLNSNKGGIRDKVKVLNLNAPYLVDKLYAQKQNEINDALTVLGINTIDEKRERLVTREAEITEELTENYIDIFYSNRLTAVEEFNKRTGGENLILKVMKQKAEQGAGEENEQLHNTPTETTE